MKVLLVLASAVFLAIIAHTTLDTRLDAAARLASDAAGQRDSAMPARDVEPDTDALVAAILDRPLFNADRRGRSAVATAGDDSEASAARAGAPRLAGVMMTPDGAQALFERLSGGFVTVHAGAQIDGWTVTRIEDMRVVLTGDDGTITLRPSAGRRPAAQATAPARESSHPSQASSASTPQP